MSNNQHGSMDDEDHAKVFVGFINIVKWSSIAIIVFLLFLAMVNG